MPKASEVAAELRKLADSIDKIDADMLIPQAFVVFNCDAKETFKTLARLMPRPIRKIMDGNGDYAQIRLKHESEGIDIWVKVRQSFTCELVEPAKPAVFRCEPILSPEEDAEMETA